MTKGLMGSAKNKANKLAIVDGNHRYTYGEFADRVSQLKKGIKELGVEKGDRVGILMLNSFRYLELFYAVTAIGAVVVPLNVRLSVPELTFVLNDAGAKVLFLHREFLPILTQLKEQVESLQHYILAEDKGIEGEGEGGTLAYEELLHDQTPEPLRPDNITEEDIAGLFYTGGTTGRSKGVMLSHKNLVSNAYHASILLQYSEETSYLHAGPMFHLADGASTFAVTLVGGTHVHIRMFHPKGVLEVLERDRPNSCLLVPTMLNMLVNYPEFDQFDTSSLTKILYGASPMPVEVLKTAAKKMPQLQFFQAYGMTEASPILTILPAKYHVIGGSEKDERRLTSCGQSVIGVEVRCVDPEGRDVPPGEVGEIIARGPNIMKGYWNLPEETAAALRDGWYYSGDLATVDEDNFYYIVDRKKDMIITGGENVYSVEVENVLYTHPGILEAAVIGVPDEKWGEVVKAVVVKKPGKDVSEEDILNLCKQYLANYKVPKSIQFVDELPKSGAGKILKRHIRDQYWKGQKRKVN